MKVKFLKSHDVYSEGDTEVLPDGLANYLIRCMVAEEDVSAEMAAIQESAEYNVNNGLYEESYGHPNPAEENKMLKIDLETKPKGVKSNKAK